MKSKLTLNFFKQGLTTPRLKTTMVQSWRSVAMVSVALVTVFVGRHGGVRAVGCALSARGPD